LPDQKPNSEPGERKRELGIYFAYRVAEWLINRVPRGAALPLASAAGNLTFDVAADKRALICANLSRPMRLPPDHRRVRRAARRAFRNYAKYLVDMMRIGEVSDRQVQALVAIQNIESLRTASAEGKGVLLCTVHVGGMDLLGPALNRLGESLHVIADDTTYGRLYDHLAAARARHRIFLIGWRNLRGLFKVLRGGGNLVLFCDGGYRRGDVPVEFCGEATTFPAGPATISARSGAPILPVWCRRTADDRFEAQGLPLIRATSHEPAEIQRVTQELADALSAKLAADPDQWYMFRAVWPQTDADRAQASAALEAARRGDDWTRLPQATAA
jgi:lauroyl/myristoyl acyltransferase